MQYTYFASKSKPSIRARLSTVCEALDRLYQQLQAVQVKISELEAQGLSEASVHWRRPPSDNQPGILELLHPAGSTYVAKHGRRREYIGTIPDRQQEALGRVERWAEYQKAKRAEFEIKEKMSQIETRISGLELVAIGRQKSLFGDTNPGRPALERPQE
jgi:hypothetical protein